MVTEDEHYFVWRRDNRAEIDRLDLQHYAIRGVQKANFLAPILEPKYVLDVGSGTGQWGFEISQQFPNALVVGLDLTPGKPGRTPGYREVQGNLLRGLPFSDARFDYVHQRLVVAGVPLAAWPDVVADLARVTRPGGWVELGEVPWEFEDAGPATERIAELTRQMMAAAGLDPRRTVFDSLGRYLEQAGLEQVSRRELSLPAGGWAGPPGSLMGQVGSLMASDYRAAVTQVMARAEERR
ncbi:MAG: class I SAM-dependent methyltransferase, partial [Actinobacteria bacterium]|nr:class I SAM-dependent methyltransferase [Actinomycetota bacterium]